MHNIQVSNNKFVYMFLLLVASKNAFANPVPKEKCALENEDCLKRAAQAMLPKFIPELGIPSLDTYHMDDLNVETPDIHYRLWDTEISGFNDTIIDDLSIYLPLRVMRLNFHTTLLGNSDYKVDGVLFGLPMSGEGKSAIIMQKLQMEMVIIFDIVKNKEGKDVMDIKSYFYGSDALDGVHSYLGNMFNGDKKKSDAFHEILNTNWRTVVANFGRFFTSKISKGVFENIQKFMRSRPLEDFAVY